MKTGEKILAANGNLEVRYGFIWERESDKTWRSEHFPVTLTAGNHVRAAAMGRNGTDRSLRLRMEVQLIDPTGAVRGTHHAIADIPPGALIFSFFTPNIPLDRAGMWRLVGRVRTV